MRFACSVRLEDGVDVLERVLPKILKAQGHPPDESEASRFFSSFESRKYQEKLSQASVARLVTLSLEIPTEDDGYLDKFQSLYSSSRGGSPLAFWGVLPGEAPPGNDNKRLISYLCNQIDKETDFWPTRRRLRQVLVSKVLDAEEHRMTVEKVQRGVGQTYRSIARGEDADSQIKRKDIAGQKWRRLNPGVLLGLRSLKIFKKSVPPKTQGLRLS